jgi:hypothetical protein
VAEFRFEQQVVLSEADYVQLFALTARRTRPVLFALVIACGIACLLWPYTVALGVVIILLCALTIAAPRIVPAGARSTYRESPQLHGPMTCGVNEHEMWVHGPSFRFASDWSNLRVWRESAGWLVLQANGMTLVLLGIEDLRKAAVYDQVLAPARQHGTEYGARQPRSRRRS